MGKENPESKQRPTDGFDNDLKPDLAEMRNSGTQMHQYMLAMHQEGLVVYCRFGRDYIGQMAKQ